MLIACLRRHLDLTEELPLLDGLFLFWLILDWERILCLQLQFRITLQMRWTEQLLFYFDAGWYVLIMWWLFLLIVVKLGNEVIQSFLITEVLRVHHCFLRLQMQIIISLRSLFCMERLFVLLGLLGRACTVNIIDKSFHPSFILSEYFCKVLIRSESRPHFIKAFTRLITVLLSSSHKNEI